MSIDAVLLGTVIRDAELRTAAAGKPWLSVIVRSGDGDAASFVQVAVFGDAAVALGRIEKNEKLYAEGSIASASGPRPPARSGLVSPWRHGVRSAPVLAGTSRSAKFRSRGCL
jgi:hypothetical protein